MSRSVPRRWSRRWVEQRKTTLGRTAFLLATMWVIALYWSGKGGVDSLSPGPLSQAHAHLEESCHACHPTLEADRSLGELDLARWPSGETQSRACLQCHDAGAHPGGSHGLAASHPLLAGDAALREKSSHGEGAPSARKELSCTLCHRGHRGRDADLLGTNDTRCQACHAVQFGPFPEGHPEFQDYPHRRRTRIAFDHVGHLLRYFVEEQGAHVPARCTHCHEPDETGDVMRVRSYEQTCARCHSARIDGDERAGPAGVAVLSRPGSEETALWNLLLPAAARSEPSLGFEERLEEFLLLLEKEGQERLRRRIERTLAVSLTRTEAADLAGGLPMDVLRTARANWFGHGGGGASTPGVGQAGTDPPLVSATPPGPEDSPEGAGDDLLDGEEDLLDAGPSEDEQESRRRASSKDLFEEERIPYGGWYQEGGTLWYRPSGHADPFLTGWLDLLAARSGTDRPAALTAAFEALAHPEGPGFCTWCHLVDRTERGSFEINWTAKRVRGSEVLTPFPHRPHLNGSKGLGCLGCHELDRDADVTSGFEGRDPATFRGAFKSISRNDCAGCHADGLGDNSCTGCHDYHGVPVRPRVRAGFGKPKGGGRRGGGDGRGEFGLSAPTALRSLIPWRAAGPPRQPRPDMGEETP